MDVSAHGKLAVVVDVDVYKGWLLHQLFLHVKENLVGKEEVMSGECLSS